jgi:hypothetical protein
VSGDVPRVAGLSYRLSANYAFADRGAYVVGPVQEISYRAQGAPIPRAELVPVDTFRVAVGLQYDFAQ